MLRIPFEVVDVSEPITLDDILERTWYGIISTPMDGKLMLLLDTAPNHILYNHPHMVSTTEGSAIISDTARWTLQDAVGVLNSFYKTPPKKWVVITMQGVEEAAPNAKTLLFSHDYYKLTRLRRGKTSTTIRGADSNAAKRFKVGDEGMAVVRGVA